MTKVFGLAALMCSAAVAQPVFTNVFPPEEYAARRAKVMEKIGDAVAIMQGTTERPGEQPLRQSNQFFYVTGVVEPCTTSLLTALVTPPDSALIDEIELAGQFLGGLRRVCPQLGQTVAGGGEMRDGHGHVHAEHH